LPHASPPTAPSTPSCKPWWRWKSTTTIIPATSRPTATSTSSIARATGNSALVGSLNYLWDQRGRLWHKLKEHFQTEELRQETLKDHRRILEAIAAHDPAAARKAMRAHLERVTRTFSRG
jgi:hypothetical protein